MFYKKLNNKMNFLSKQLEDFGIKLQKSNLHELIYILGNKKEIIKRNLLAGISRGIVKIKIINDLLRGY